MSNSDDFVPFLVPEPENFGYRQGYVLAWDAANGTNTVSVGGGNLENLAVITTTDLVNIRPGDSVALIRYNDSYGVLGKIKKGTAGTPWMPVPLYAQFNPLGAAGSTGYWSVAVGTLASWEGRIFATHHSFIEVDGVWGAASGTNTVTYQVQLGGNVVGSWTTSGSSLDVGRRGPFAITPFKDQQFLKVEVKITSSTGSGNVAMQMLACFLR